MIRLFNTHRVRRVRELEGDWDFAPVTAGGSPHALPDRYGWRLPVPGCWENHPAFSTYSGQGVYRTFAEAGAAQPHERHMRLVFKGVSHTADIYIDGAHAAHHYNAYTAFDAVVPLGEGGRREIAVRVDNSFGAHSALHVPNDYYTYGGLIRPVALEFVADTFIEHVHFTPSGAEGSWRGTVRVTVRNAGAGAAAVRLTGKLGGTAFAVGGEGGQVAGGSRAVFETELAFPDAAAWTPEAPSLHLLEVRLYADGAAEPCDDLIERVGFRTIAAKDGRIQLNGRDIVLQGFNRHEDHPMAGAALPYPLMVQDMELMRDMGANAVRTSHYPNDERFLDLCDERGMLVWEENHARGLSLAQMQHPLFEEQCEDCNREMVEQHFNHPSIVIWAILNECASDTEEGRAMYGKQLAQIRSMDGSRLLSFASHHRDRELCFDLADVVSFNLYPLWYGDEDPGELVDQARGWAEARGGAGKPMIMSEFGGDGHYGFREPTRVKGSEERQADIIERNLAAYTARPFLSGMFIWQFCDCRVTEGTGWLLARAGTQNSKGIVDRYRRPKLAYGTVKRFFGGARQE